MSEHTPEEVLAQIEQLIAGASSFDRYHWRHFADPVEGHMTLDELLWEYAVVTSPPELQHRARMAMATIGQIALYYQKSRQ